MSTAKEMDNNEAVLGALQQVRYVSALAKVDATVEIAKETLQNEPAGESGTILFGVKHMFPRDVFY